MRTHILIIITILLGLTLSLSSCRRHHRHRDRESIRTERSHSNKSHSQVRYSFNNESENEETKAVIEEIAQSEDYDKMLNVMMQASADLKKLSKLYLKGNMTDAALQKHIEEIQTMYKPVNSALEAADSEGKLTYNQHKKQMKVMAEYIKTMQYVINRLANDINDSFR